LSRAIIYLSRKLPTGLKLPTLQWPANDGVGRAALNHWYMWHFSMQGLPPCNVTITSRELLPHVFTLTACFRSAEGGPKTGRGNFLWHCLLSNSGYPAIHRCIALCCPDFPPFCRSRNAIARLVANIKINHFRAVVREDGTKQRINRCFCHCKKIV